MLEFKENTLLFLEIQKKTRVEQHTKKNPDFPSPSTVKKRKYSIPRLRKEMDLSFGYRYSKRRKHKRKGVARKILYFKQVKVNTKQWAEREREKLQRPTSGIVGPPKKTTKYDPLEL